MKKSICGANCAECPMNALCKGCVESGGCPFGKQCFIANYVKTGGEELFQQHKKQLIAEINALSVPGMPEVQELYALVGSFVNLEYPLPNGESVKFLDDNSIYLGAQLDCDFGGERCFGVVAGMDFLLICTYGEGGSAPELVLYRKR